MSTPAPTPTPSVPMTAPVTIYNARINDLAPTVVTEQIADNVQFVYNPLSATGSFTFTSRQYVYIDGVPQQLAGTNANTLQTDVAGVLTEMLAPGLADPVTGQDLSNISIAGIVTYIKNAFDIIYNRKAQAQATPDASTAYPSQLAITQANTLYDLYGNGLNGYPLGKAFGGLGTSDGAPTPTPLATPPNPIAPPAPVPTPTNS